jgi:hypothetical protein
MRGSSRRHHVLDHGVSQNPLWSSQCLTSAFRSGPGIVASNLCASSLATTLYYYWKRT